MQKRSKLGQRISFAVSRIKDNTNLLFIVTRIREN